MPNLEASHAPAHAAGQSRPSRPVVKGRLRLQFEHRFERDGAAGRTVLAACAQRPPLKVVRSFPLEGGGALVHLHNLSGGVLGGDQLELDVEVGPGACAQLTSTGATRLYRSRSEAPTARQINNVSI